MFLSWIHSLHFSNTRRDGDKSCHSVKAPILVFYPDGVSISVCYREWRSPSQPASLPERIFTAPPLYCESDIYSRGISAKHKTNDVKGERLGRNEWL